MNNRIPLSWATGIMTMTLLSLDIQNATSVVNIPDTKTEYLPASVTGWDKTVYEIHPEDLSRLAIPLEDKPNPLVLALADYLNEEYRPLWEALANS